jgi:hypothetical protein
MPGDPKLAALTRSLVLGVSVGTISLTQVGCAAFQSATGGAPPDESAAPQAAPQAPVAFEGLAEGESQLCSRALETRSPEDVDAVLLRYPESRCVGPLLGAMPASTLGALSTAAVSGLPRSVLLRLPYEVLAELPSVPRVRQTMGAVRSDSSSGGY